MPLFFFHIDDGGSAVDGLSLMLPNALAARNEAAKFAGEMLQDRPAAFWEGKAAWTVTVADDTGATLFILTLEGRASSAAMDRLHLPT